MNNKSKLDKEIEKCRLCNQGLQLCPKHAEARAVEYEEEQE